MAADISRAGLNLTTDEKKLYGQLFQQADTEGLGVVTGDVAVKFFERTKLDSNVLGEIWQIADTENRGLLTPSGFSMVLRLIGHCQNGSQPTAELATRPGPLPKFDVVAAPAPSQSPPPPSQPPLQQSPGPIRVPPLTPDKVNEYSILFDRAGARNGVLGGDAAKQMFEKAGLPNEVLGRVWSMADTEQRGALNLTEFIIAMHLITSMRSGALRFLPQNLPAGLYEAAARRASAPVNPPGIRSQFTGPGPQRTQTLTGVPSFGTPPLSNQSTGNDWLVTPQDKTKFDQVFASIDKGGIGHISGDQAVQFFSTSGLSGDVLASIWDLADINSEGQLNREEFAVAMYLIRQQRGKRDDRGILPTALPPNLIPPSMRQRHIPPSQPTAPTFETATPTHPQPKSAAEDLFGLDAMSASPDTQTTQVPSSPQNAARSFPAPGASGTTFKPFTPMSSFGQGLASQNTGSSVPSSPPSQQHPQQRGVTDDLLGDGDPEISSKLTAETSELGNMSNQIGTLRNQMQEVQAKRSATENDLSATSNQKRELEARLSQFRSQYEEQVKVVKTLEEQLSASRTETRKLQQELAMIEGAHQDLQSQHHQLSAALEADQRENASLKERIRVLNGEIAGLKPQLEKMRSDARQQKGLVAINKKQLATSEGEKDKIQNEMTEIEKAATESSRVVEPSSSVSPSTSPPPSTAGQSTNPFFRNASSQSVDRTMSPAIFTQDFGAGQDQNTFDSIFQSPQGVPQTSTPPPTTFRGASQASDLTESREIPATSTSPPPAPLTQQSPNSAEPPAPPESRQITSNFLPFRNDLSRSESFSSSVKANPPASRAGFSNTATPIQFASSPAGSVDGDDGQPRGINQLNLGQPETLRTTTEPDTGEYVSSMSSPGVENTLPQSSSTSFGPPLPRKTSIPGAFPADTPEASTPVVPTAAESDSLATPRSLEHASGSTATEKDDFDSTFRRMEPYQTTTDEGGVSTAPHRSNVEFPPIEEIQGNDDTDSDTDTEGDRGFEDHFVQSSNSTDAAPSTSVSSPPLRSDALPVPDQSITEMGSSGSSRLATPPVEATPPAVGQSNTISEIDNIEPNLTSRGTGDSFGADAFDSTSQNVAVESSRDTTSLTGGSPGFSPFSRSNGVTFPPPRPTQATAFDDFDAAFEDLSEAKEADDLGNDGFVGTSASREEPEFNPMFDSPAPSRSNLTDFTETPSSTMASTTLRGGEGVAGFGTTFESPSQQLEQRSVGQQQTTQPVVSDDWDELFAGLDTAPTNNKDPFALDDVTNAATTQEATSSDLAGRPALPARAVSAGTEHDDPILKSLTGMGFARNDALMALEKYDYNLDKAADYLTSKS